MTIAVTVLFATYNGAKTLPRMLDALTRQTIGRDRWKLVAVDNNSSDDTQAVLHGYLDRLPLEVVSEPRQGKQFALTTGLARAEGELLILTDDDVLPDADWIEQFFTLADEHPEFSIFGGLIEPAWESEPQPWVLRDAHLGALYAMNGDLPEGPARANLVFGPNSAFRQSALSGSYLVHDDIGPNGDAATFPMGEDTAFARSIERQGGRAFHSRRPRLRHIIKAPYVDEGWMLARAERFGMGIVAVRSELFKRKARIAGLPVAPLLLAIAMAPVAAVLRPLPFHGWRHRLLWKQGVRIGVLKQFARQRAGRRARIGGAVPS
jgi:glycosyltransferase involved in cell wall biosynthesis